MSRLLRWLFAFVKVCSYRQRFNISAGRTQRMTVLVYLVLSKLIQGIISHRIAKLCHRVSGAINRYQWCSCTAIFNNGWKTLIPTSAPRYLLDPYQPVRARFPLGYWKYHFFHFNQNIYYLYFSSIFFTYRIFKPRTKWLSNDPESFHLSHNSHPSV